MINLYLKDNGSGLNKDRLIFWSLINFSGWILEHIVEFYQGKNHTNLNSTNIIMCSYFLEFIVIPNNYINHSSSSNQINS